MTRTWEFWTGSETLNCGTSWLVDNRKHSDCCMLVLSFSWTMVWWGLLNNNAIFWMKRLNSEGLMLASYAHNGFKMNGILSSVLHPCSFYCITLWWVIEKFGVYNLWNGSWCLYLGTKIQLWSDCRLAPLRKLIYYQFRIFFASIFFFHWWHSSRSKFFPLYFYRLIGRVIIAPEY